MLYEYKFFTFINLDLCQNNQFVFVSESKFYCFIFTFEYLKQKKYIHVVINGLVSLRLKNVSW